MINDIQGIIDGITSDARFKATVVKYDHGTYVVSTNFKVGGKNLTFMMSYYNYNEKWKLSHRGLSHPSPVVKKILADYKVMNSSGSMTVDVDTASPGDCVYRLACAVIEVVGMEQ